MFAGRVRVKDLDVSVLRGHASEMANEEESEDFGKLPWWRRGSPIRRRLHSESLGMWKEANARISAGTSESKQSQWYGQVKTLARDAATRASSGPLSDGFEALNAARRVSLETLSTEGLQAIRTALLAEANSDKLTPWRKSAIINILGLSAKGVVN